MKQELIKAFKASRGFAYNMWILFKEFKENGNIEAKIGTSTCILFFTPNDEIRVIDTGYHLGVSVKDTGFIFADAITFKYRDGQNITITHKEIKAAGD